MNPREKAKLIADWLGYHDEALVDKIKSLSDAEKLYTEMCRGEWPEMLDDWTNRQWRSVVGYAPYD